MPLTCFSFDRRPPITRFIARRSQPILTLAAALVLTGITATIPAARAEVPVPELRKDSPVLQDELNQQIQKATPKAPDIPVGKDTSDCVNNQDPQLRIVACTHAIEGGQVTGDDLAAAYYNRAIGYSLITKYDAAVRDFNQTLKLKPDLPVALVNRGITQMRAQRPEAAKQDFDTAIAKDPDNVDARYWRAWLESQQGRDKDAITDLNDVLAKHPDHFDAMMDRGGLLIRSGRYDDAIKDFSAMLKISPKAAAAFYNRGRAKFFKGDYAGAADDFANAMKDRNDNPYAAMRLHLARQFQAQSKQKGGNAAGDPAALKASADKVLDEQWPVQIVRYFQGTTQPAAIFSMIDADYPKQGPVMRCELNYYLGQAALLKNDRKAARDYFKAAIATKSTATIEYIDSNLALAALGK